MYDASSNACRYATILMYLNDVEGGGETAFPVADNETFDSNVRAIDYNHSAVFCLINMSLSALMTSRVRERVGQPHSRS